jgi:hypothetical protein
MLEDSGGVADGKAARRRCARESPKGFLHHQLDMCSLGVACLTLPAALHPDPAVPNAQPCILAMDPDGDLLLRRLLPSGVHLRAFTAACGLEMGMS